MHERYKKVMKRVLNFINSCVSFIILLPAYFIGIGLSRLFARMQGKRLGDGCWNKTSLGDKYRQF